jgi:hypothetical protein
LMPKTYHLFPVIRYSTCNLAFSLFVCDTASMTFLYEVRSSGAESSSDPGRTDLSDDGDGGERLTKVYP